MTGQPHNFQVLGSWVIIKKSEPREKFKKSYIR